MEKTIRILVSLVGNGEGRSGYMVSTATPDPERPGQEEVAPLWHFGWWATDEEAMADAQARLARILAMPEVQAALTFVKPGEPGYLEPAEDVKLKLFKLVNRGQDHTQN